MRGSTTLPDKVEEVKAKYAETNNYSATAEATNLPLSTAYQIIKTSDDFEELRNQVRMTFIKQGFEPMMKTLELTTRKIDELQALPDLKGIDIKALTGALKDLKTSMENVGNTINVIGQQNIQNNYSQQDREEFELADKLISICEKKYGTISEAIKELDI
jgi:hypothetical protein